MAAGFREDEGVGSAFPGEVVVTHAAAQDVGLFSPRQRVITLTAADRIAHATGTGDRHRLAASTLVPDSQPLPAGQLVVLQEAAHLRMDGPVVNQHLTQAAVEEVFRPISTEQVASSHRSEGRQRRILEGACTESPHARNPQLRAAFRAAFRALQRELQRALDVDHRAIDRAAVLNHLQRAAVNTGIRPTNADFQTGATEQGLVSLRFGIEFKAEQSDELP